MLSAAALLADSQPKCVALVLGLMAT